MATEFVVLGSGTAVPTPERGAAGYLLNTCKSSSMLDCGPGSTRKLPLVGRELIDVDRVLISHFHTDHVCDLSAFIFGSRIKGHTRNKPLELVGPVGLKNHYEKIVNLFGKWVVPDEFELRITELDCSPSRAANVEFEDALISAKIVAHSYPSVSYRIETEDAVVVYSGDTDYCESIVDISKDADLGLLECSSPDEAKIAGHLTPGLAGKIAREAGVKHLVLSHFYPVCFGADILGQCQKEFQGKITLAEDLMRFTLDKK